MGTQKTPPNRLVRIADRIVLVDPKRKDWRRQVLDNIPPNAGSIQKYLALDIPVDSSSPVLIQHCLDWIDQVRCDGR
jgi:hypothetical protein